MSNLRGRGSDSSLKQTSPAVFGTDEAVVRASRDTVRKIAAAAAAQPLKRARFCAHRQPDDPVHEMLIVLDRDTYIRPHRHFNKSESFHVIDGACDLVLFDDTGEITHVIELGTYETGRTFYYRLSDCLYHTLLIRSDPFIVHETTNGPFRQGDAEFAPWAPEREGDEARSYMVALAERVKTMRSTFAGGG